MCEYVYVCLYMRVFGNCMYINLFKNIEVRVFGNCMCEYVFEYVI